jgi:8-oxo-dGTP pyrophosphatase MutT (NUDIX family)
METIKYQGKMFAIVERKDVSNGHERILEIARRAPGVRLIIELPDGNLLLTREHRSELGKYDVRLPGGKVCDSLTAYLELLATGEDIAPAVETAARLEAKEEAGVDGGDFVHIHTSVSGLTVDWDLHYFSVKNAVVGDQALEEHEDIETIAVSKENAKKMCLDGSISEERSALVLLKYLSQNP